MQTPMTAREAAEKLRISYWKILELVRQGKIPHLRVDRRILFQPTSLEAWLGAKEASTNPCQTLRRQNGVGADS